jgi:predicted translation initiation factor SUI1
MKHRQEGTVLFLCTDNYHRSRFAEVLFVSITRKMGLPWNASSRALALERGVHNIGPMAIAAIKALEARYIRDGERCKRPPAQVTMSELEQADVIVALQHVEHLPLLQERFPTFAEKVEFWHMDDTPDDLPIIESKINDLLARLLGGGGEAPPEPIPEKKPATESLKKARTAKVGRETAGRRGKGVTTVFDLPLDEETLKELATKLKQRCGTGGTVKDGRIEIQGDQRDRIVAELENLGFKVKRVGG